jgi:hypothetical protein
MSRLKEKTERDIYKDVLKKKSELYNLAEAKIALFESQALLLTIAVGLILWILIQVFL